MLRSLCLISTMLVVVACVADPVAARPHVTSLAAQASHGRWLGKPDLALVSALYAVGGGPQDFSSARLSGFLAGAQRDAEVASLERRFGAPRVAQFFKTFDFFVDNAVQTVQDGNIPIPPPSPALTRDPYELAAALRAAGVMPDGRFDVGYFIERLMSRPIHVALMQRANDDPAIGPAVNADFHVILTAEMNDLTSLYHLPH